MTDLNQCIISDKAGNVDFHAHEVLAMWLRKAREQSGMTIDAVSQETKISKNYIVSLESGKLDALPGKVFGRGFVKNITKLLKTDSAEGLRLYDACWGEVISGVTASQNLDSPEKLSREPIEVHKTHSVRARMKEPVNTSSEVAKRLVSTDFASAGEKPRVPRTGLKFKFKSLITMPEWLVRSVMNHNLRLLVLAAVATGFVALVFGRWAVENIHKSKFTSSSTEVATETIIKNAASVTPVASGDELQVNSSVNSTVDPASEIEPMAQKTTSSPVAQKVGEMISDPDEALYLPTDPGVAFEQVLELKVSADVEIRLTLDGKKLEKTWFEAKEYKFTFNERAEIQIADASKLELMFNGKSLGELGGKGRKRKILFQAKATANDFPQ